MKLAIKLPRLPLQRIPWRRPSQATVKKMVWAGLLLAALAGAFCWGRFGRNEVQAQTQSKLPASMMSGPDSYQPSNHYKCGVVAFLYGGQAITREELGEYLIERVGPERIEYLVNRRIIEIECAKRNINITQAEIDAQIVEDCKQFKCTERQFVNDILRRYNKTLFEWKEDVIRPKLGLQKLVENNIRIDEDDLRKGFEAKYGDKVECRLIVLTKEQGKDKYGIWEKVRENPDEFDRAARNQQVAALAAEGGKIPPIHHYFGDPNIEKEAFKLKAGEISPLIGMQDGTTIILKCVCHIPRDTTKDLDKERLTLFKELGEMRLAAEMPKAFQELRTCANPQIFLKREALPPDVAGNRLPQPGMQVGPVSAPAPQTTQQLPPAPPALPASDPVKGVGAPNGN
jgi:hypothetical protein